MNVTLALLSEKVTFGEHVPVTVCDAAFVPVPPHEVGAFTVFPAPCVIGYGTTAGSANVRIKLRASVNVVLACEAVPTAVKKYRRPTS